MVNIEQRCCIEVVVEVAVEVALWLRRVPFCCRWSLHTLRLPSMSNFLQQHKASDQIPYFLSIAYHRDAKMVSPIMPSSLKNATYAFTLNRVNLTIRIFTPILCIILTGTVLAAQTGTESMQCSC